MKTYQEFIAECTISESVPAFKTTAKDGDKVGMGHMKDWTVKKFKEEYEALSGELKGADKKKKKEISAKFSSMYANVTDDAMADMFIAAAKAAMK